jgi:hypothetical protein
MTFTEKTKELKLIINKLPLKNQVELLNEYRDYYQLSERNIASKLGMSKSQVHRLISLKVIPKIVWDYLDSGHGVNVEKYVLYELSEMPDKMMTKLAAKVVSGDIQKVRQLRVLKDRLIKGKKK